MSLLTVHGVYMALSYDFVMCAFMSPSTVHGVVSEIRDVHFRLLTMRCDLLVQAFRSMELIAD